MACGSRSKCRELRIVSFGSACVHVCVRVCACACVRACVHLRILLPNVTIQKDANRFLFFSAVFAL